MRLLPQRKDIDKAKADERKRMIDDGMALAKKVDVLRETKAQEEKNLLEYRNGALKTIQAEIDSKIKEKDELACAIEQQRKVREKLLEPLDEAWIEVETVRLDLGKQLKDVETAKLRVIEENNIVASLNRKLSEYNNQAKLHEQETEQAKIDAENLKQLAQKEYETARFEHDSQTTAHEKAMAAVSQAQTRYEVATKTAELETKKAKEAQYELRLLKTQEEFKQRQHANH